MTHQERLINGARYKLETAALKYARMVGYGKAISPDGHMISFTGERQKEYISLYNQEMCEAACNLLVELSLLPLPERESNEQATV